MNTQDTMGTNTWPGQKQDSNGVGRIYTVLYQHKTACKLHLQAFRRQKMLLFHHFPHNHHTSTPSLAFLYHAGTPRNPVWRCAGLGYPLTWPISKGLKRPPFSAPEDKILNSPNLTQNWPPNLSSTLLNQYASKIHTQKRAEKGGLFSPFGHFVVQPLGLPCLFSLLSTSLSSHFLSPLTFSLLSTSLSSQPLSPLNFFLLIRN